MATREYITTILKCACGAKGEVVHSEWENPMHHGGSLGERFESVSDGFSRRKHGFECKICSAVTNA